MQEISLIKDSTFLRQLDTENIKTYYVKILILNWDEEPVRAIEGRVSAGSISITANAAVKRAGNITFLAEEAENDLTDIDNLLSINKKIKILIGFENTIDKIHEPIIWFNQGIFVIVQPSLTHSTTGVTISLQFKDKMCLLNGEQGGNLPTSVTFHEYDQIVGFQKGYTDYPLNPNNYTVYEVNGKNYMWDPTYGWDECNKDEKVGSIVKVPQLLFDIIQTAVCNFGNEAIARIQINDVPREIKNIVRYIGTETLYYCPETDVYTLSEEYAAAAPGTWQSFVYNEDCGHIFTELVYTGELITSIGDNVCTVLDKIKNLLGNYEYFYDINGHFVFQEKKNYLNTSYDALHRTDDETLNKETLSTQGFLLSQENYYVDFSNSDKSIYTFDEGSKLITSYANNPNYSNIKNDYHIWGKNNDGLAIHYHLVIKEKPISLGAVTVNGISYPDYYGIHSDIVDVLDEDGEPTGVVRKAKPDEVGYDYITTDWRAELYMQGLENKWQEIRPDIYQQELLDLYDIIYDMRTHQYKADIVNHPNDLLYWIDYINPAELVDISVDAIGTKMKSYQQDKIVKLYTVDVPYVIMIDSDSTVIAQASIIEKCQKSGQQYSRVSHNIYNNLGLGTYGYSAQEVARDLLYQYTDYVSGISISSIPIYYLDVNNRITVNDRASGISGDYVVSSINLPLDPKSPMTISASTALDRV